MTATARDRLVAGFDVAPAKVTVIPHGATTPLSTEATDQDRPARRAPLVLTWGLLGPGKGIEWAIDAMAQLVDLRPSPEYLVAGATHPKVRERSGESYRRMLVERAADSPARSQISFDDTYRDLESLTRLIRSADVVVLPYDSDEQVTSGVLVDAVAAGRPVVSTAFPHAVELLASGAGIVVPQRDPDALAAAIRTVLTDHRRAASMAAEARRLAPDLSWASVARRYEDLGAASCRDLPPWCHDDALAGPPRVDERWNRALRARRPRRASPRARLLHRRRGPTPGRLRAGSPSPTVQRSSSPAPPSDSSSNRRERPVARGIAGPPEVDGTAGAGSRTAGGAACGRSERPLARAPEEWMRRSGRSYFDHGAAAAFAAPAIDGVRGARRRRRAHDRSASLLGTLPAGRRGRVDRSSGARSRAGHGPNRACPTPTR